MSICVTTLQVLILVMTLRMLILVMMSALLPSNEISPWVLALQRLASYSLNS
jgi:hypothetical protein